MTPASPPIRPIRVLNLIDSLGSGGSEWLLTETVRASDPREVRHFVTTAAPDLLGDFRYTQGLQQTGAWAPKSDLAQQLPRPALRLLSGLREFMRNERSLLPRPLRFGVQMVALAITFPRALLAGWRVRPDVVHAHTFYSSVHGAALGAILRRPVVYTVPCAFSQMLDAGLDWLPGFIRSRRRRFARFFTGYPAEALRAGAPPERIVALRSGLNLAVLEEIRTQRAALRARFLEQASLPSDAWVVLCVGRLHPSKGIAHGLAAFARAAVRFPQLHLVVLGEGAQRRELEAQIAGLGLGRRIHLLGFVSDPLPAYAAADVFLRTYLLEGNNLSGLQALGAGIPVAGFDTGHSDDLVRLAGAGRLVPPGDEAALAQAVEDILGLPDRGRALGLAGARALTPEHSIVHLVGLFNRSYGELVPGPAVAESRPAWRTAASWLLKLGFTAGCFAYILRRIVSRSDLSRAAHSFPLWALGAMLGLSLLQRCVTAWQTSAALGSVGIAFSPRRVFHVQLITGFLSLVLPGEMAGAAVSWHLFSRDSGQRAQAAAALIYLRLLGLFVLILAMAGGLVVEPRLLAFGVHWVVVAASLVVGLPLLAFTVPAASRRLKRFSVWMVGPIKWRRMQAAHQSFWDSVGMLASLARSHRAVLWITSLINYGLAVASTLIAMAAARIDAPWIAVTWFAGVANLSSLVPLTVGGFGVRELSLAVLMSRWYGVPADRSVLFSIAMGAVGLFTSAVFGGLALLVDLGRSHGVLAAARTTPDASSAGPTAAPRSPVRSAPR